MDTDDVTHAAIIVVQAADEEPVEHRGGYRAADAHPHAHPHGDGGKEGLATAAAVRRPAEEETLTNASHTWFAVSILVKISVGKKFTNFFDFQHFWTEII